ncbi:hypothetical protein BZG36_03189 [Bifiguratus adelaidae]|uniref:Uncharacterized protein n=1 Tax=Bifiguratus adelaidae TaxID=1938954 RepID=A0A261XYJ4_9FUNG|nr:hypothetical protein BZG36_03189 [Bifiguratus adelaidae]
MAQQPEQLQPLIAQAQSYINEEKYAEAVETFTKIHEIIPAAPMPLLSRATAHLQLEQNEAAKADLLKVLDMPNVAIPDSVVQGCHSMHSAAYMRLAKIYVESNDEPAAAKCMATRKEIEQGTHPNSLPDPKEVSKKVAQLKEQGNKLFANRSYMQAGAHYKQALDMDPSNAILHANMCQVLIQMRQFELALFHAEQATLLKPDWAKGWYRLGSVHQQLNNHPASLYCFLKSHHLCADTTTMKAINSVRSHVSAEDWQKALKQLSDDGTIIDVSALEAAGMEVKLKDSDSATLPHRLETSDGNGPKPNVDAAEEVSSASSNVPVKTEALSGNALTILVAVLIAGAAMLWAILNNRSTIPSHPIEA